MNTEARIQAFNDANRPFYIVAHDDGKFSLCLPLDFLGEDYDLYCQSAFDAYAAEIGDPPLTEHGRRTHGNGYEWEAAFRQAFEKDPNLEKIFFDCEAGGFFCTAGNLELLEDYGSRFKEICEDAEKFTSIVSQGIRNMEAWEKEQEQLMRTVRGRLMCRPGTTYEIRTPDGNIRRTPEDTQKLIDGEMPLIKIGDTIFASQDLLEQEVTGVQIDLFDSNLIRMRTEVTPEQTMTPVM